MDGVGEAGHISTMSQEFKRGILKNDFSSRTYPFIFAPITPVLLNQSNETSWVFPAFKSTRHFLAQSTVSDRSNSSSEANSSCQIRSLITLRVESEIISIDNVLVRKLMYSKKIEDQKWTLEELQH